MKDYEQIKKALTDSDLEKYQPFSLLSKISQVNNTDPDLGRDLVIRTLEHEIFFEPVKQIYNELIRSTGLFPYLRDTEKLGSKDRIAVQFNRPETDPYTIFHREQAIVYRALLRGENVVLSAPTSFGKTLIIDKLIESGRYSNILIIVPTISLIDELRKKTREHKGFKIITHNDQARGEKNIYVLTQERAIDRLDINQLDLLVIDEFYKLDPESEEGNRYSPLNIALYKYSKISEQIYLLGPNINEIPEELGETYNIRFFKTHFNTVCSELIQLNPEPDRETALLDLLKTLTEPTLIYCKSPKQANDVLNLLSNALDDIEENSEIASWIEDSFHDDWSVGKAYRKGISLHHGQIPRSLAQINVKLFDNKKLRFLICTSSLIEGVNTAAKNVIIYESKVARKQLEYFTFKNIQGRAGRMFKHFVGRIYTFDTPPSEKFESVDIPAVTKGDSAPDSLLVHFDESDMNDYIANRLAPIQNQHYLPMDIIKDLTGMDPASLVRLSKDIFENAYRYHQMLNWTNPSYEQLKFCCELAFNHLKSGNNGFIRSASQLTLWLNRLRKFKATKAFIEETVKTRGNFFESPNQAIEAAFDFQRRWASFIVPQWFMAIHRIQEYALPKFGLQPGNYTSYIARVESLFEAPEIINLDEYGLPIPLGKKLSKHLTLNMGLDEAIKSLKCIDLNSIELTKFELEIIKDFKENS